MFRALAVCMNLGLRTAGLDRSQGHAGEDWLEQNKQHCTTDDKHKQVGIVVFYKTVAHFELRFLFLNIQQAEQTCSWLKQNKQQYWWQTQTNERQKSHTHTHKKNPTKLSCISSWGFCSWTFNKLNRLAPKAPSEHPYTHRVHLHTQSTPHSCFYKCSVISKDPHMAVHMLNSFKA